MRSRLPLLGWLLLGAFIANTTAGFLCYRLNYMRFRGGFASQWSYSGAAAAAQGWPVRPPAAWPPPTGSDGYAGAGHWYSNTTSTLPGDKPGFQMTVGRYGWPAPVFEQAEFWWPWNDPQWKTTVPHEAGLRLYWPGFVLLPLAVAIPAWLILPVPGIVRRRFRRSKGLCPKCGYPAGPFAVCPECGVEIPAQASDAP